MIVLVTPADARRGFFVTCHGLRLKNQALSDAKCSKGSHLFAARLFKWYINCLVLLYLGSQFVSSKLMFNDVSYLWRRAMLMNAPKLLTAVLLTLTVIFGGCRHQNASHTLAQGPEFSAEDSSRAVFPDDAWRAFEGDKPWIPAFPDKASRYDSLVFKNDTGDFSALKITGEFPYARYFGLNVYDFDDATDIAAMADFEIIPDEGSTNPFVPGADRQSESRRYTVYIVKQGEDRPEGAKNVIVLPEGIKHPSIFTRVYRPDRGIDSLGGVGLPRVEVLRADLTPGVLPSYGIQQDQILPKAKMFIMNEDLGKTWEITKQFSGNRVVFHRVSDASLFPNAHNEYIVAPLPQDYANKVAIIRLENVPTFEHTYEGGAIKGGTQVRYWSFCTGGLGTTRTVECLNDDQIKVNHDGSAVIAIAPFFLKHKIDSLGWNHMRWGALLKPIILHRHMLADPSFDERIGNVSPIGRPPRQEDRHQGYFDSHAAKQSMKSYGPTGEILTIRQFHAKYH